MSEQALQAEILRLNKIVEALMNRAEHNENRHGSDFNLFHTAIVLEEQVRRRTDEVEAALRDNERITRDLRDSEAKFRALVDQSMVGITLTDGERFTYANPGFAEMLGYSIGELMSLGPMAITPEKDRPRTLELIREGLNGIVKQHTFVVNVLRKDGSVMNAEISGARPIHVDGKRVLMSVWMDVTERLRIEQEVHSLNLKLRDQSIRDALTGLFNRRYLEESLSRELAQAQQQGHTVSLIMGDIDYFKAVNDTSGHQAGDKVLKVFGDLIGHNSRSRDICCRYGGEEFLLVLPNVTADKAYERAEKLRLMIADQEIEYETKKLRITASFGVATYPACASNADGLISAADTALYAAKSGGRNQVKCCGGS